MNFNKAMNKVWQAESISNQKSVVRDSSSVTFQEGIGVINNKIYFQEIKFSKCGLFQEYKECPAYKVECLKCGGLSRFAQCCLKRG